jgi:hypothetical protein
MNFSSPRHNISIAFQSYIINNSSTGFHCLVKGMLALKPICRTCNFLRGWQGNLVAWAWPNIGKTKFYIHAAPKRAAAVAKSIENSKAHPKCKGRRPCLNKNYAQWIERLSLNQGINKAIAYRQAM